jgi:hypothetical protein
VPAALALGYDRRITGAALIGPLSPAMKPRSRSGARVIRLRQRGFHPAAPGRRVQLSHGGRCRAAFGRAACQHLGIAASSAAGLFAFVNGGADIKRCTPTASREAWAALLANQGVRPPV